MKEYKVFAPATIANLGPGFDLLGVALNELGDIVEARSTNKFEGVKLEEIVYNLDLKNPSELPTNEKNVAVAVGQKIYKVYKALGVPIKNIGIELILYKNMGIGTGLGSSASSSVAAAVAVNNVLGQIYEKYLSEKDKRILDGGLLEAVVYGEKIADGGWHADNVWPCLFGGFVFCDLENYAFKKFEGYDSIYFVVVSPNLVVETRKAREALNKEPYNTPELVKCTRKALRDYLNGKKKIEIKAADLEKIVKPGSLYSDREDEVIKYIKGAIQLMEAIKNNDAKELGKAIMTDNIITPVRANFIGGFSDVKEAARSAGAYGFSIASAGSSVFAVADNENRADAIGKAMTKAFKNEGIESRIYISTVNNTGAERV